MSCSDPSRMIASPYPSSTSRTAKLAVEVEVEPGRVRTRTWRPARPSISASHWSSTRPATSLSWPYPSPNASGSMYTSRNGGFSPAAAHCPSRSGAELCRRVAAEPVERRSVAVRRERGDRSSEPRLAHVELVEPVRVRRAGVEAEGARRVLDTLGRRARVRERRTRAPRRRRRRSRVSTTNAATSNATKTHRNDDQAFIRRRARRSGRSDSVDRTGRAPADQRRGSQAPLGERIRP